MKIDNFEPKELANVVKKLEREASRLKRRVSLISRIKQWLFGK